MPNKPTPAEPPAKDEEPSYPEFRHYDKDCPNFDGYIFAAGYANTLRGSTFEDWRAADGRFLGLVERSYKRQPIYHRLCEVCRGHFYAIGASAALEPPSRGSPTN
jgi:hypothetical protein